MFSIADMAVAGAVALLLFGPDQLPKVARRAGQLVRDVQNSSQSFIREMERAADSHDHADVQPIDPAPQTLPAAPAYHETPEPAAVSTAAQHEPAATSTPPQHEPPAASVAAQHEPAAASVAAQHEPADLHPRQPPP